MKKFVCLLMLSVMVMSEPLAAFAMNADRIGENVLSNVLSVVIIDTIRNSSKSSKRPAPSTEAEPNVKTSSREKAEAESEPVIGLSEAQFQSFSEICLAGSLSEFQKKFENENISPDAVYIQKNENNTVITSLLQLAKTSPNPDIAEFLREKGARE